MIKTSNHGYIHAKIGLFRDTVAVCVPTGETRDTGNGIEALVILLTTNYPERKVWIRREDVINTPPFQHPLTTLE